jgi:hypothetical protein
MSKELHKMYFQEDFISTLQGEEEKVEDIKDGKISFKHTLLSLPL